MPSYIRRLFGWAVVVPLASGAAAAVIWPAYKFLSRPDTASARSAGTAESAPVEVQTAPVVRRELTNQTILPGSVAALNQATLYAKASGYLRSIPVDKGDWVKRNQILAVIDVPETDRDLLTADLEVQHAAIMVREAEQAAEEAVLAQKELDATKVEAENLRQSAEIALRVAAAAAVESESSLAAAKADAHLQKVTLDRIAGLFSGQSATLQERDQQESKSLMAEAGVKLAEAKLSSARLLIDSAKSKLQAAVSQVESASARLASGVARVESARSKVTAAQAKKKLAESAKERVAVAKEYANIRAPYDGVITARHVDPGAMIQNAAGSRSGADPLVTIAAIDRVRVVVDIPEREVKNVAVGANCALETDSLPGVKFDQGSIVRTAKAVDPKTRTMPAEAEFDNPRVGPADKPDFALYPGMYGRLTLNLSTYKNALVVPAAAISIENRQPYVYAVRAGRIRKIAVKLGYDDGVIVQIKDTPQLKVDDQLVIGDKAGLTEGRAAKAAAAGAGPSER